MKMFNVVFSFISRALSFLNRRFLCVAKQHLDKRPRVFRRTKYGILTKVDIEQGISFHCKFDL